MPNIIDRWPFKILLEGTDTLDPELVVYAIVSGATDKNYQELPLEIKKLLRAALLEWLDLPENKARKQNLDADVDINDFEGLLNESMFELLEKVGLYDLDIYILPVINEWKHIDNLLD